MELYTLPIRAVRDEAPRVRTYLFDIPDGVTWEPGAHVHVALPGFDANGEQHRELTHHLSICTLASEGMLGFTTRLDSSDSVFKTRLATMGVGDELAFFKFNCLGLLRRDGRPVVALSQGVGIATIRPLILATAADATGVPHFTSITTDRDEQGIYASELAKVSSNRIELRRVAGRAAFAQAVSELPQPDACDVIVIGGNAFIRSTYDQLRTLNVADEHILIDRKPMRRAEILAGE